MTTSCFPLRSRSESESESSCPKVALGRARLPRVDGGGFLLAEEDGEGLEEDLEDSEKPLIAILGAPALCGGASFEGDISGLCVEFAGESGDEGGKMGKFPVMELWVCSHVT